MPASKPSYPEEFKREVLAYQASTGSGMKETASHFGILTGSIRAWRLRLGDPLGGTPDAASIESPEQELTRLRRENRELHMRCEILKKTEGIFSDPSVNDMSRPKR
jgi:transposase